MHPTPRFYLQIVDPEGVVARLPAGGALEADLVESCRTEILARRLFLRAEIIEHCTAAIMKRGVGLFKTSAHVQADIEAGLDEVLKVDVQLSESIAAGVTAVIKQLKLKTVSIA